MDPAIEINGELYPIPQAFRLGDPVLVRELTGMDFVDFAEALDDEARRADPVLQLGIIGVAVWQKHPTWRREKVARFVSTLPIEALKFIGGDDDEESASPPGDGEPASSSPPPLSVLTAPPGSGSTGSNIPQSSGLPGSVTGSPA